MNELALTKLFIEEMNSTNSVLSKKEVLKAHPEMKTMLEFVYNPFKQYYVTSTTVKKKASLVGGTSYDNIYSLLLDLTNRVITGHTAIATVNKFIQDNKEYEDIIYMIIDKDLECRVGDSIINSIYPKLIPTFPVALAEAYKDVKAKVDLVKECYYASRKMNGCRCITSIDKDGDIHFFSREGHEFETLDLLKEDISLLGLKNVILDGEICLVDEKGNESFQGIMSLIRRKDYTIPNPKYLTFDCLGYDEFYNGISNMKFTERQEALKLIIKLYNELSSNSRIEMLTQTKITSMEHFAQLCAEAAEKGWEGLIVRKDTSYKGKRSRDLIKVKEMRDAEYVVKDIEVGPFRIIENGTEVTIETLSAVMIEHKGNVVRVGSGFTLDERREYYTHPERIVGQEITVQYFTETQNKEGQYSLQFPVFKFNHGNRRSV